MELHDLHPAPGAKKSRKRIGRGPGSGTGKTAGKGHKGQKSRSGYSRRYGFEGGQMPLVRRIPKRGFFNIFRVEFQVVNLKDLERLFADGDTVTVEMLVEKGLVRGGKRLVKVLGDGELSKKLIVQVHKFSASGRAGIEKAGGSCEVVTS
ncbi:MAG: 50S ribosomal protein L15 [Acidobacteria bacterium]|jgi:large subunit ribosomal protein L15|nr:50S ribosomal protein L15 [Candidatus Sulfomarinibacter kjeldsenii]MBD3855274.1 50S ribosomal protein L15 [Candidatus Sulfomarinibacter kjeldsenii]MDH3813196.1 50S ribosomal protein L15 [Acidobacteriota bacterium]